MRKFTYLSHKILFHAAKLLIRRQLGKMIASAIDQKGRGVEKHEVGGAEKVNADALRDKQGNPNWNAILKWSIDEGLKEKRLEEEEENNRSATAATDERRKISEEDRKWFLKAMEAGVIDEVKRIKEISENIKSDPCLRKLKTVENSQSEVLERVYMLEELRDRLESIDNAKDLGTIGGLSPLLEALECDDYDEIRAISAECVAVSVQNHPEAQKNAMNAQAFTKLLNALDAEKHLNSSSQVKVILALSCLCRGNVETTKMFCDEDGIEKLSKALFLSKNIKIRIKALYLIQHVCVSSENAMERTINSKVIDQIASKVLKNNFALFEEEEKGVNASSVDLRQERECCLRLLTEIATKCDFERNPSAIVQFRSDEFLKTLDVARAKFPLKENGDDDEDSPELVAQLQNMLDAK
jgi:hypothetical protein